ncbi:acyltransferase [Mesorhizobium sp. AR07]|uniref:acyltransferase family protein n=1 Tax=Mesorhizobium sp. AR07 TaxID=2865838 RepID=UPI00215ED6C3|nr:acyltransferase [Mesorhizobium sp. AR07]UVK45697.1 acyltransferase [Mesorhizobium sp. AR07]
MEDNGKIEFANSLRGIAALLVVVAHHFIVFWRLRDTAAAQMHAPVLSAFEFPTPSYVYAVDSIPALGLGAVGVALFFLISGFVIPFSFQKTTGPVFLIGRFFRLVPTYAVAFSVTLLAIFVGTRYFGLPWPYDWQSVLIHYMPGLRDIAGSPGIDGIVWTLEVEVKFYLICAVLSQLLMRHSKLVFLAPVLLFVFALCVLTGGYAFALPLVFATCFQYVIFMFIGVAFHYHYVGKLSQLEMTALGVSLLGAFGILWVLSNDGPDTVKGWNYALAIVLFAAAAKFRHRFKRTAVLGFLADISYPLYACHAIAGYIALRILIDLGVNVWVAHFSVFCGVVFAAWLIHILVEAPSHSVGRKVVKALSRSRQRPQTAAA